MVKTKVLDKNVVPGSETHLTQLHVVLEFKHFSV